MQEQQISCPICEGKIIFDIKELITGRQFECPNCRSKIGLADTSRVIVEDTVKKIEEIKESSKK